LGVEIDVKHKNVLEAGIVFELGENCLLRAASRAPACGDMDENRPASREGGGKSVLAEGLGRLGECGRSEPNDKTVNMASELRRLNMASSRLVGG